MTCAAGDWPAQRALAGSAPVLRPGSCWLAAEGFAADREPFGRAPGSRGRKARQEGGRSGPQDPARCVCQGHQGNGSLVRAKGSDNSSTRCKLDSLLSHWRALLSWSANKLGVLLCLRLRPFVKRDARFAWQSKAIPDGASVLYSLPYWPDSNCGW